GVRPLDHRLVRLQGREEVPELGPELRVFLRGDKPLQVARLPVRTDGDETGRYPRLEEPGDPEPGVGDLAGEAGRVNVEQREIVLRLERTHGDGNRGRWGGKRDPRIAPEPEAGLVGVKPEPRGPDQAPPMAASQHSNA